MSEKISFKPKQVAKKVLSELHPRTQEIMILRYGLGGDAKTKTLESVGKKYGITRERVRQIEKSAITLIRSSDNLKKERVVLDELKKLIFSLGGILPEEELLESISNDKVTQNTIRFFLTLGEDFVKYKEDKNFKTRWSVDPKLSKEVHKLLKQIFESLSDQELLTEGELISRFLGEAENLSDHYKDKEMAKRWLLVSKKLGTSPLGDWGKINASGVKIRGVRDYAYLVMRKNGSPLHYKEVAENITKTFGKKCHVATCHNELIKDPRFVLVGRGMYALKEWGYKPGTVKDTIKDLLRRNGPMKKDAIVEGVLREKYLKKNTILVNLQNSDCFKKDSNNYYHLVENK